MSLFSTLEAFLVSCFVLALLNAIQAPSWLCEASIVLSQDELWTESRVLTEPVIILPNTTLVIRNDRVDSWLTIDLQEGSLTNGFLLHAGAALILQNVLLQGRASSESVDPPRTGIDAVQFVENSGARVVFDQVYCRYMRTCLEIRCCSAHLDVTIQRSIFAQNTGALTGISRFSKPVGVRASAFLDNEYGLQGADWNVSDSVFVRNKQISTTKRTWFVRCFFWQNLLGIIWEDQDPDNTKYGIHDSFFYLNREALGQSDYRFHPQQHLPNQAVTAPLYQSTFVHNNKALVISNGHLTPMDRINVLDSTEWSIEYHGAKVEQIPNRTVFFGTTDSSTIRQFIYDAYQQGSNVAGIVEIEDPVADQLFDHPLLHYLKAMGVFSVYIDFDTLLPRLWSEVDDFEKLDGAMDPWAFFIADNWYDQWYAWKTDTPSGAQSAGDYMTDDMMIPSSNDVQNEEALEWDAWGAMIVAINQALEFAQTYGFSAQSWNSVELGSPTGASIPILQSVDNPVTNPDPTKNQQPGPSMSPVRVQPQQGIYSGTPKPTTLSEQPSSASEWKVRSNDTATGTNPANGPTKAAKDSGYNGSTIENQATMHADVPGGTHFGRTEIDWKMIALVISITLNFLLAWTLSLLSWELYRRKSPERNSDEENLLLHISQAKTSPESKTNTISLSEE